MGFQKTKKAHTIFFRFGHDRNRSIVSILVLMDVFQESVKGTCEWWDTPFISSQKTTSSGRGQSQSALPD